MATSVMRRGQVIVADIASATESERVALLAIVGDRIQTVLTNFSQKGQSDGRDGLPIYLLDAGRARIQRDGRAERAS